MDKEVNREFSIGFQTTIEGMASYKKPQAKHGVVEKHDHSEESAIIRYIKCLIDALPFYVLLVDENHHIILANKAVETNLSISSQDCIGKYCPKVVHGIDEPFPGCPLEEVLETGEAIEREFYDSDSGKWINSAIYPTEISTAEGKGVFFHMVVDITRRKQAEEQIKNSRKQLRNLSAHLETIREDERTRMARELHDQASQLVVNLNADIALAMDLLPSQVDKAKSILKKAKIISGNILQEITRLIYELRPALLDDFGLKPAIGWLANHVLGSQDVQLDIETRGRIRRISREVETTVFRVVQEILSNIRRHAYAKNVNIQLHYKKGAIQVKVKDDGIGFDVGEASNIKNASPRGLGLLSMTERVEILGGTLNIQSCVGSGGTVIDFEIPLPLKKA